MKESPIGFFDSGIGGTSIWREVVRLLPNENTLYLADSKNAPYGVKSRDEIIYLSEKNTEFLLNHNVKIIVVACNTATTNAISHLRRKYEISFIGIEPAIKPAALQSKTKMIGILATKGTLTSELFHKNLNVYAKENNIQFIEQVGNGLVELIEEGLIDSQQMKKLLNRYLDYLTSYKIDYLVLGCTHYPYLKSVIRTMIDKDIVILESGVPVAKQTQRILKKEKLLNQSLQTPTHNWITNKDIKILQTFIPDNTKVNLIYLDF